MNIEKIRIDGGTQSRVEINNEAVSEYAEALKGGVQFPPVDVFFDGADYWLVDGFHRYHAHHSAGLSEIGAVIHNGTLRDAQLFSFGVNASHGLRRSNADKRKAVEFMLNDAEWSVWSDREIARQCCVSHVLVFNIRKSLTVNINSDHPISLQKEEKIEPLSQERTYTTKHGTQAVMKTANIGKSQPQPQPKQPEPQPEGEQADDLVDEGDIQAIFEGQEKRIAELEDLNKSLMASDKDKEIYDLKSRIRNEESQKLAAMEMRNRTSNENDAMYRVLVQAAKFHGIDHNQSIFALCKALLPCFKKVA